jgi:hypothetical protein
VQINLTSYFIHCVHITSALYLYSNGQCSFYHSNSFAIQFEGRVGIGSRGLPVEGCIPICCHHILPSAIRFGVLLAIAFLSGRRTGIEEALDDVDAARPTRRGVRVRLVVAHAIDAVRVGREGIGVLEVVADATGAIPVVLLETVSVKSQLADACSTSQPLLLENYIRVVALIPDLQKSLFL